MLLRPCARWLAGIVAYLTALAPHAWSADLTVESFIQPPDSARPWVWAQWLHSNVDRESISTQLQAMQRVGLGGVTLFDVAQPGIPAGPYQYFDPQWQDMFSWELREAARLGLETMGHVGPGYSGTGGPWIKPELAAQKIVFSSIQVLGGQAFSGPLPQPPSEGAFYRDVAVLAVREDQAPTTPLIEDFEMKSLQWLNYIRWRGTQSASPLAKSSSQPAIARNEVFDLTALFSNQNETNNKGSTNGHITWQAPAGKWTILRIGHTWTGQLTLPAPPAGVGPECDKLNPRGIRTHFRHVMQQFINLAGTTAGKSFHTFFMDSWEAGGQNWTETMPEEFRKRRGYDIRPYLPVLTGRLIDDLQTSERFLYDLRLTVAELLNEAFWSELHQLCHEQQMRLALQPYITGGNDFEAALHCDEPMGECWASANVPGNDYRQTIKLAASAANLNDQRIVGCEAFTSNHLERWLSHPAKLKSLGDQMFCLGANRLQFHRFAMQRFPQIKPGMMMGGWGLQYDATQTWWEWTKPWHDYLARCQWLLRQGRISCDVLVATPEEPLYRLQMPSIPGYNFDLCPPSRLMQARCTGGALTLPQGGSYRLLNVEHTGTMSLERLRHLRDLVQSGAALLGEPPLSTPGLFQREAADAALREIVRELWGDSAEIERHVGKGRVFRGISAHAALQRLDIQPDFESEPRLSWIHRHDGSREIYFIASDSSTAQRFTCRFRQNGKVASLWEPESARVSPLNLSHDPQGRTQAEIPLGPQGSVFVIFESKVREDFTPAPAAALSDDNAISTPISSPWQLRFPTDNGAPAELEMSDLTSWHLQRAEAIRHFSGTAEYRNHFELPASFSQCQIDLGEVEVMARVYLNGKDLGILWKKPYSLDVTAAAKPGSNELRVDVVNLWVNRLIGDAALPSDSKKERDARGRLTRWPDWLLKGKPSPTGRHSFVTFPLWKTDEPLQPSGLLGPVTVRHMVHQP